MSDSLMHLVKCCDCKARYTATGSKVRRLGFYQMPSICGVCGSDFIAVKTFKVKDEPVIANSMFFVMTESEYFRVQSALTDRFTPLNQAGFEVQASYWSNEEVVASVLQSW